MPLNTDRIPFGLANITIGDVGADDQLKFDGVNEFQADGGEFTVSPILEDITVADFGNGPYDQRIVGYEGTLTITAAQESIAVLKEAIAGAATITDTTTGDVVGLMDAPIGTSLRKTAKRVHIHPRNLPASMKDMDITIFKMASNGEFTRSTGNTQGNITINLTMYPKDGMDPSLPGNYFFVGGTDPYPAAPATP